MEKKLKIILCVVLTILIALVAFLGVYSKDEAGILYKSKLPDYVLSSDFKNKRVSSFIIDDSTEEKIYDADGKEVDSIPEGESEDNYKKEETKINPDWTRTLENYEKAKEILEGRLKILAIDNYLIRLDKATGNLAVELTDELDTDTTLQYLSAKGDFEITDTDTGDVLMDRSDLDNVSVIYGRDPDNLSAINVYVDFKFNKTGKEKLAQISRDYIKVEESEEETETTDETDEAENSEDTEDTESEESKQKTITITIEGQTFNSTYFGEEMTTGELPVSIGSASNTDDLQTYLKRGQMYEMLLNNDEMPLTYTITNSEVVRGNLAENGLKIATIIVGVIFAIIAIYSIIKYKADGLIMTISYIFASALLALLVRYTRTVVSINSFMAGALLLIVNSYIIIEVLRLINNEEMSVWSSFKNACLKNILLIVIAIIIAVVFTFMSNVKAYSFGITLFYGVISIAISNFLILRTMLLAHHEK